MKKTTDWDPVYGKVYHPEETPDTTEEWMRETKRLGYIERMAERRNRLLIQAIKRTANSNKNILMFSPSGLIRYVDLEGKTYETKLGVKTNAYKALKLLVENADNKLFTFDEIGKILGKPRRGGEEATTDRRVRDTIQSIKTALKYKGEDLFESDYGFRLKCVVQIVK